MISRLRRYPVWSDIQFEAITCFAGEAYNLSGVFLPVFGLDLFGHGIGAGMRFGSLRGERKESLLAADGEWDARNKPF